MATATSRKAAPPKKLLDHRRKLTEELVDIDIRLAPDYARIDTIGTELKAMATTLGESFKEEFAGKGHVSVSGAHGAEFKGEVPVIQTEKWLELKAAERKQLLKSGLVVVEKQWGKASNGRVTVKTV